MNAKLKISRSILKSVIVLGGVLLFTVQGTAGVSSFYKWKDDQGKVHFTDDPLKIPTQYRSPAKAEERRGLPPPKSGPVDAPVSPRKEKDDLRKKVSEEEQAAMQKALSFLKNDIQRYKKYENYVPQKRHAVLLRNEIVGVLPEKEALNKTVEKFDTVLLKDIGTFLKQSLQRDYEAKSREHPRRLIFIKERSRINEEFPKKNTLVEKLEAELASLPQSDPAQSKPSPASADN
jgi:deoxyribodipyrimidine photolyase